MENRQNLKELFSNGTRATQEKFESFIDSTFNKEDDSILEGPMGMTGQIGLWISNEAVPFGPTSEGIKGQVIISGTAMYICHEENTWIKTLVETQF